MHPFTTEFRDSVRTRVLEAAEADERIVAGAEVGSSAAGKRDRWSDLDLTFAVAEAFPVGEVLDDWTRSLTDEWGALQLFDLPYGTSIYRVFLLPGCLQLDVSLTPASSFGAVTPEFQLLFGEAVEKPHIQPRHPSELFGLAVHHAVRARICIERGRLWQAEYWISGVRDETLSLACRSRSLSANHGRGFDDLPADIRDSFAESFVTSLTPSTLRAAIDCAVAGLLRVASEVPETAGKAEADLRLLSGDWDAVPAGTAEL